LGDAIDDKIESTPNDSPVSPMNHLDKVAVQDRRNPGKDFTHQIHDALLVIQLNLGGLAYRYANQIVPLKVNSDWCASGIFVWND